MGIENEATAKAVEKLRTIRARQDLKLKPTKYLRKEIQMADGSVRPLQLRYYQIQMVCHLLLMDRFIVGDDMGLGKCFSVNGMLPTTIGTIPGKILLPKSPKEDTFYDPPYPIQVWDGNRYVDVKRVYYSGIKPTRKIRTQRGYEIEGTLVHPLWVRRGTGEGWVCTQDIQVGDYVCVNRSESGFAQTEPMVDTSNSNINMNGKLYNLPSQMNPNLARLIGYIVAEAWTKGKYSVNITQHKEYNPEVYADICNLCLSEFGWHQSTISKNKDVQIDINSVQIRSYLKLLGIEEVLSANKRVPDIILQSTRESQIAFLKGLFDGEASVSSYGIEISSASEELMQQVQNMLLRLGMLSSRNPKKVKGYEHNTYWRVSLCGDAVRKFKDIIGFKATFKQELLDQFVKKSNPNLDVVPFAKSEVETMRAEIYNIAGLHGFKGNGVVKRWGVSFFNTMSHIRAGKKNATYRFLQKMLTVADELGIQQDGPAYRIIKSIIDQNYFYDSIKSITESTGEVMDLEVDSPEHKFVANGFINHNTIESISSACYLWEKDPTLDVLVLTKKSVVTQWKDEILRFTEGVHVTVSRGTKAQRQKALKEYQDAPSPKVLVTGYRSMVQDFTIMQNVKFGITIFDEASMFKNPTAQVSQVCRHIASQSKRVWGLTGTLIKNNLMEGFGIYKVVCPSLFPHTPSAFMNEYCIVVMMDIKGRKIPTIKGYRLSDIERFRQQIEPFYLGRPKHEVASELPPLTTNVIKIGMSDFQRKKYKEALDGMLDIGDTKRLEAGEREVTPLTAVTYCQEIVNHPGLIGFPDEESEKLDTLVDMLSDGDLAGKKVIVYTRFSSMVDFGIKALEKEGVKCVRITGAENEIQRSAAQKTFQNMESGTDVIWITNAGSDAINLQSAEIIVFYDTPFSAGDYLQILGRMIRIGSIHTKVLAIHLVCTGTIDERVIEVKDKKMTLIESVIGKRIKGEKDDFVFDSNSEISDLFDALKADAKSGILRV